MGLAEEMEQDNYELLQSHRDAFKDDHDHRLKWRKEAKECYNFESGDQWDASTVTQLEKEDRPHITINKIRPTVNVVAGFQRLNPYEPSFLPRTGDDLESCKVALGVTKYVLDNCVYSYEEGRVFLDAIISGLGVIGTGVEWDFESLDADVFAKRTSPFDVYPDRESQDPFWRDAERIHSARWVLKDNLINIYPEKEDEIKAIIERYSSDEDDAVTQKDGLYFDRETKKVRLIQTWYKEHYVEKVYVMDDKTVVPEDEMPDELKDVAKGTVRIPLYRIRVSSWIGDLLLEDMESPYKHKYFPFIPVPAYQTGEEGDSGPDGIVADLIDPQRETNKRRSQALHIINTMANRGWKYPRGSLDDKNKTKLKEKGATPGIQIEYLPMQGHGLEQFGNDGIPIGIMKMEEICSADMREISGINESFLSQQPLAANTSGRALEIRNRQAITSIARIFDNLRIAKLIMMRHLWGTTGKPGLIPQYFTDKKVVRITDDGSQANNFVAINQPQIDDMGNTSILNDLTKFDFDIVISETPSMTTQRERQFQQLLEAAGAGIPIPPELIVDASDWADKDKIKQAMMQAQQAKVAA